MLAAGFRPPPVLVPPVRGAVAPDQQERNDGAQVVGARVAARAVVSSLASKLNAGHMMLVNSTKYASAEGLSPPTKLHAPASVEPAQGQLS
jgi:hypothetical protein